MTDTECWSQRKLDFRFIEDVSPLKGFISLKSDGGGSQVFDLWCHRGGGPQFQLDTDVLLYPPSVFSAQNVGVLKDPDRSPVAFESSTEDNHDLDEPAQM